MAIPLTPDTGGVQFMVKVVPGSSRQRIVGQLGDALKIAVAKPPQDGAANRAVIKLLAESLSLPESSFTIVRGQTNPRKQIRIAGVSVEDLSAALSRFTDG
jgi:uncharacterized protein (TIGR00251 family)